MLRCRLPRLARIGQRFDELSNAYHHFRYGEEHLEPQRELVRALKARVPSLASGQATWDDVDRELFTQFGERFADAKLRILPTIREFFESGQMPAAEWLEWVAYQVEMRLAADGDPTTDWDALESTRRRLCGRMEIANYESERDRQMRDEDPDRYAYLEQSMSFVNDFIKQPEEQQDFDALMQQQAKLFQASPLFAQAQEQFAQMQKGLERLRQINPELYAQQKSEMERLADYYRDPVAATERMIAETMAAFGGENQEADDLPLDTAQESLPAGRVRVTCKQLTSEQKRFFDDLAAREGQIWPGVERALRQMHAWMGMSVVHNDPREAVLFPKNVDETDIPLDCFKIELIELTPDGRRAIIRLESLFGHFDEHGCGILIEDGRVSRFGTWDDLWDG